MSATYTMPIPSRLMTVSAPAVKAYLLLSAYLDNGHQPARAELAMAVGFNRVKSVDRYLRELEVAGLIAITRSLTEAGGRNPNTYALVDSSAA